MQRQKGYLCNDRRVIYATTEGLFMQRQKGYLCNDRRVIYATTEGLFMQRQKGYLCNDRRVIYATTEGLFMQRQKPEEHYYSHNSLLIVLSNLLANALFNSVSI